MERYFIKQGYQCNVVPGQKIIFDGLQGTVEDSAVWQYEAYEYAGELIKKHEFRNILDIGCGYGMKLKKLISPLCQDITGIDESHTISWCRQHHYFGTWYADNLEDPKLDLGRTFDLIISADVIEHLVDPNKLLDVIKKYASKDTFIVLSTPERDTTRGKDNMGPPANPLHAREWNFDEFRKYVEHNQFTVIRHFRAEAVTPLQFQDIGKLRRTMKRILMRLLWILTRRNRFLPSGQVILAKYEPYKRKT